MFSQWPIWNKLKLGLGLLAISIVALFLSGLYGLYSYRGLVKTLSARSAELPLANELSEHVAALRVMLSQAQDRLEYLPDSVGISQPLEQPAAETDTQLKLLSFQYINAFDQFRQTLDSYRHKLKSNRVQHGSRIGDHRREQETLSKIDELIAHMEDDHLDEESIRADWILVDASKLGHLRDEIEKLHELVKELPSHLHGRLQELSGEVRTKYRLAINVAWVTAALTAALLIASAQLFRKWIARPLKSLVEGSREVARNRKFDHRIRLETHDEMQELAEAMNEMTARFQETRDDLDRQVRERTRQVVRSEQLASVGFLAAGVAHEINNPLASIALCSESLESRLQELLGGADPSHSAEQTVVQNYLEMIQKEAFRCKQITEKLLDFSRMGDSEKHHDDLRELVAGVIEMVCHLGRYQDKNIELSDGDPVIAQINSQEMKQVVLNLITNGLDSLDSGGTVTVSLDKHGDEAEIIVKDDGCGMTEEVIQHLFEPFFTRRRGGQGTGLGLSITFRIVEEHHGQIVATSDGAGHGSKFTVTLPLRQPVANEPRQLQAA